MHSRHTCCTSRHTAHVTSSAHVPAHVLAPRSTLLAIEPVPYDWKNGYSSAVAANTTDREKPKGGLERVDEAVGTALVDDEPAHAGIRHQLPHTGNARGGGANGSQRSAHHDA